MAIQKLGAIGAAIQAWRCGHRSADLASMFRRRLVGAGLVAVIIAAVVTFLVVQDLRQTTFANRMAVSAQLTAEQVDQLMLDHQAVINLVASHSSSDERWPKRLARVQREFPTFSTMLVADPKGDIVYTRPFGKWSPDTTRMRSIRDRDYFKVPMATGNGYISNAFRGRTLGTDAIVAISAPLIVEDGEAGGIVEGSIRSETFARVYDGTLRKRNVQLLILDREKRVVHATTGLRLSALDVLKSGLPEGQDETVPVVRGLLDNGGEAYVATAATKFGWTVAIVQPTSIMAAQMRADVLSMIIPAGLALIAVLWVATVFSRRLSDPIRLLSAQMRDYTLGLEPQLPAPEQAPVELRELSSAFRTLVGRANAAYAEAQSAFTEQARLSDRLSETLDERDTVIATRTAELRKANEELVHVSRTDALTGCRNYRGFREDLPRLLKQCADEAAPLSVIACDIDYFKRFNDRYGHPAGDACLQRVASALRGVLYSPRDVLARVGGEEFVVLLPLVHEAAARQVAERLRQAIESLGVPHEDSPFGSVTLSFGCAVAPAGSHLSSDTLLSLADDALYESKQQGRNQVTRHAQ